MDVHQTPETSVHETPDINSQHQSATAMLFHVIVRCVVRDVTVNEPLARFPRWPNHIISLARPEIVGVGLETSRLGKCLTVTGYHSEGPPCMCIGWMKLLWVPIKRTFKASPTFMWIVSVEGYALPLIVK
jgi:hypothetical protein